MNLRLFGKPADQPFNIVIAIFASFFLAAIVASLRIATLRAPNGSVVVGANTVWRGHTACFRAAAIDADLGELIPHKKISFALNDETRTGKPIVVQGDAYAEVNIPIPDQLGNNLWLQVTVRHGDDDEDNLRIPLQWVDDIPPAAGTLRPWEDILQPHSHTEQAGGVRLALYPSTGTLVGGFLNTLWGLATKDGVPWQGTVTCGGPHVSTSTNAEGFFQFPWRPLPGPTQLHLDLVNDHARQTTDFFVVSQAKQMLLEVQPRAIVTPHETLQVHLDTLPFRSEVIVDFLAGPVFVWGQHVRPSHEKADLQWEVPADLRGLIQVAAYRHVLDPLDGASRATRWVGRHADEALLALEKLSGEAALLTAARRQKTDSEALPLVLSRYTTATPSAVLLANSTADRLSVFAQTQHLRQQRIHRFLACGAALGIVLASVWATGHRRRIRHEVGNVVQAGLDAGEDFDPALPLNVGRGINPWALAVIVFILLTGVYGLFTLMATMRWK